MACGFDGALSMIEIVPLHRVFFPSGNVVLTSTTESLVADLHIFFLRPDGQPRREPPNPPLAVVSRAAVSVPARME
jgi:hypothetical protein